MTYTISYTRTEQWSKEQSKCEHYYHPPTLDEAFSVARELAHDHFSDVTIRDSSGFNTWKYSYIKGGSYTTRVENRSITARFARAMGWCE